jgi:IS30 family transposase
LVVVDVGSRKVDCIALKTKQSQETRDAFVKLYDNGILSIPKQIDVDDGSEFKGECTEWFQSKDVHVRVAQPNRHSQQAIVESTNAIVAKYLFLQMNTDEIQTKVKSTIWQSRLSDCVKWINEKREKMRSSKPISPDAPPKATGNARILLKVAQVECV